MSMPRLAEVMPLPSEERTPPEIKTYFVESLDFFWCTINCST
jgi:hypothetical protein